MVRVIHTSAQKHDSRCGNSTQVRASKGKVAERLRRCVQEMTRSSKEHGFESHPCQSFLSFLPMYASVFPGFEIIMFAGIQTVASHRRRALMESSWGFVRY